MTMDAIASRPDSLRSSGARLSGSGPEPFEACPDGGRCWHGCPLAPATDEHPEGRGQPCWRVANAAPLTSHGYDWTDEEKTQHAPGATEVVATARVGDRIHTVGLDLVGIANVAMCGTIFIPKLTGDEATASGLPRCRDCLEVRHDIVHIQQRELDEEHRRITALMEVH